MQVFKKKIVWSQASDGGVPKRKTLIMRARHVLSQFSTWNLSLVQSWELLTAPSVSVFSPQTGRWGGYQNSSLRGTEHCRSLNRRRNIWSSSARWDHTSTEFHSYAQASTLFTGVLNISWTRVLLHPQMLYPTMHYSYQKSVIFSFM